jgi:hypothetical protein
MSIPMFRKKDSGNHKLTCLGKVHAYIIFLDESIYLIMNGKLKPQKDFPFKTISGR